MSFLKRLFNRDDSRPELPVPGQKSVAQLGTDQSVCPYCNQSLDPKPKRQKKCPRCANTISVRKGYLLTEEEKNIYDWLGRLSTLGVTLDSFQQERQQISKQFGPHASVNDTVWRILNLAVTTEQAETAYYLMADLARGEGKDPKPYQAEALKVSLLGLKRQGVTEVQVFTANDNYVCPSCRFFAKTIISVNQALKDMPLPHKCTSETGCRCIYMPTL